MIRFVSARRYRELRQAEAQLGLFVTRLEAVRFFFREWAALDVVWRFLKKGGEDGGPDGDVRAAAEEFRRRLGRGGL
jgi:hypothetical protein